MAREPATGYDWNGDVSNYPRTYPPHPIETAQMEYQDARRPMIGLAEYFRENPSHRSWVTGPITTFEEAQANLIKALAEHQGKSVRAVQLEFKEAANRAHEAASKIQSAYRNKTGRGRRHRKSRSTRRWRSSSAFRTRMR